MNAKTGRKHYVTRTVRVSRREAVLELDAFSDAVDYPRRRSLDTTMGELFEQWFTVASPGWAANTVRHTHSVVKVHLEPRFGHLPVGKVTTVGIDAYYAEHTRPPIVDQREIRSPSPDAVERLFEASRSKPGLEFLNAGAASGVARPRRGRCRRW